ncbi:uncharacterized protein [Drosophila kikkawai]|uniref:Uncharacterized protein isoform X3 n=1 Tax=Drosophila kikkawai TaxID=30033 RepID=A0A6P4IVJ4_DROKI
MSEPENNDSLISNVASETCYLDLDYSEIDVENELKSCDCSLIGLEDDSATNISELKIRKQLNVYKHVCPSQTYLIQQMDLRIRKSTA